MSKRDEMKKVRDALFELKESPLYTYRIENKFFPVIGEGSHDAEIVFIGEAPGKNEAMTGRPFCGASGKILDQLLAHIGVNREDVYITNIVKDRPENNRDPKPEEIALYAPFLISQLEIIQPKVIATLGRFSMDFIMRHFGLDADVQTISTIHGKQFTAKTAWGSVCIVPLYHPAVAVYNRTQLVELQKDFEVLKKVIS
jgi:DNA polymerase